MRFTYANISEADGCLVLDDETDDDGGCPLLDVRTDAILAVARRRDRFTLYLTGRRDILLIPADEEAYGQASELLPTILRDIDPR